MDGLWADQGLRHPPRVERLPRQATRTLACADRLNLRLPEQTPSWCLLHELAHAMSTTHDGRSDGHGPAFVGLYLCLLTRYLRFDREALLRSLAGAGLAVDPEARPAFLDASDA